MQACDAGADEPAIGVGSLAVKADLDLTERQAGGDRDAVVRLLAVHRHRVAEAQKLLARELVVFDLRLLEAQYIRLVLAQPVDDQLAASSDRVDVPGGDPHGRAYYTGLWGGRQPGSELSDGARPWSPTLPITPARACQSASSRLAGGVGTCLFVTLGAAQSYGHSGRSPPQRCSFTTRRRHRGNPPAAACLRTQARCGPPTTRRRPIRRQRSRCPSCCTSRTRRIHQRLARRGSRRTCC